MSTTTSVRRRINSVIPHENRDVEPIQEDAGEELPEILFDKDGNRIELSAD